MGSSSGHHKNKGHQDHNNEHWSKKKRRAFTFGISIAFGLIALLSLGYYVYYFAGLKPRPDVYESDKVRISSAIGATVFWFLAFASAIGVVAYTFWKANVFKDKGTKSRFFSLTIGGIIYLLAFTFFPIILFQQASPNGAAVLMFLALVIGTLAIGIVQGFCQISQTAHVFFLTSLVAAAGLFFYTLGIKA